MSSTFSSSPTDGTQEPTDFVDSRNPSRQTSYHEGDVPAFPPPNYIWPPLLPGSTFPIPHVQSLESMQTLVSNTSPIPYYAAYPPPLLPTDQGDSFAICQQTGAWTTYTPDTANIDLCQDFHAGIQRTDSTLSADALGRNGRTSFPIDLRSKSPLKGDSDRVSRSRSIVGVVIPPTDPGVKRLRKARRRNSTPLVSSGVGTKVLPDVHGSRHSPAKEEAVSNDELLSSEDEDSRHRPKNAEKEPTFACPFYRRWPARHIECMSRKLTRIQDVKQHIYRRHSKPQFYCPTCAQVFASPDPRDDHIRLASCTPAAASSKRSSDGISAQVQDSLKNRFRGRLSPVEQWYSIWDLIFPGESPPTNAHVGSKVIEMLGMLRDFWQNESHRIIPGLVKPSSTRPLAEADLQSLMLQMLDKVQDHFEDEPGEAGAMDAEGTDNKADYMMDRSPVRGKSGGFAEDEGTSYELSSPTSDWDNVHYSANGSPTINIRGRTVEPPVELGSSGMLVEQHYTEQQSWMNHPLTNPPVNRFQ
ncbi:hypothetical protein LLEC1_01159 [Akanthomyces lecanii]|uniref:C2H2-type domain-containing protein n=1 Tax=Cordyceps confragosa TaxID=2714763 RepID=A0A179I8M5_CORDF|nr:hypothetical protein LLEC1_01159 [Akanthomyces lecanii]